jgi:hypothetical protein
MTNACHAGRFSNAQQHPRRPRAAAAALANPHQKDTF